VVAVHPHLPFPHAPHVQRHRVAPRRRVEQGLIDGFIITTNNSATDDAMQQFFLKRYSALLLLLLAIS
jgi:hypothetical protein